MPPHYQLALRNASRSTLQWIIRRCHRQPQPQHHLPDLQMKRSTTVEETLNLPSNFTAILTTPITMPSAPSPCTPPALPDPPTPPTPAALPIKLFNQNAILVNNLPPLELRRTPDSA